MLLIENARHHLLYTYCGALQACCRWTTALDVAAGIATKLESSSRRSQSLPSASSRLLSDDRYLGSQNQSFRHRVAESLKHYERTWLSVDVISGRPGLIGFTSTHSKGDIQVLVLSGK